MREAAGDKDEIKALFDGCHSNLETPLIGSIGIPTCYGCKNILESKDPFKPYTCKIIGTIPKELRLSNEKTCLYKIT